MKLTEFIDDNEAVSPVIGVILMVAITVILAAVIGTFVLGLGDQVSQQAPQASFAYSGSSGAQFDITHDGGDQIDTTNIDVNYDDTNATAQSEDSFNVGGDQSWTAGETYRTGNYVASGTTIRIVWNNPSSDSTNIISEREV